VAPTDWDANRRNDIVAADIIKNRYVTSYYPRCEVQYRSQAKWQQITPPSFFLIVEYGLAPVF
jgi:hypothetical protein